MEPLSEKDIQSELSYAYLHAVATAAGACCEEKGRLPDNRGIDASLTAWAPYVEGESPAKNDLIEVGINIQLKATKQKQVRQNGYISYFINSQNQYNDLRSDRLATPRILVLLLLPRDVHSWVEVSPQSLIMRDCAYWVSLRGAATTSNDSGQTVYLPESQIFTPDSLRKIFVKVSKREPINYKKP